MKNSTFIVLLVVLVVGVLGFMVFRATSPTAGAPALSDKGIVATVYTSPTCGCCTVYASYMDKQGYSMDVKRIENMSEIKRTLGIPNELESCHTMEVGGYVVEGHIPEEAIQRLLTEKPDIKGIGMAGMPAGSPGMPGPKTTDFVIYEITHAGERGNIFMTI